MPPDGAPHCKSRRQTTSRRSSQGFHPPLTRRAPSTASCCTSGTSYWRIRSRLLRPTQRAGPAARPGRPAPCGGLLTPPPIPRKPSPPAPAPLWWASWGHPIFRASSPHGTRTGLDREPRSGGTPSEARVLQAMYRLWMYRLHRTSPPGGPRWESKGRRPLD